MRLPITPSQTVGPYLSIGLLGTIGPALVRADATGATRIRGRVLDGAREPVPDALVELWQADTNGCYATSTTGFTGFGRSGTVDGGSFEFVTVKPGRVPAPDGGLQAPHVNVGVFARGLLKRLFTRIYFPDESEANAADAILSALDPSLRETLVARAEADGSLRFDIRLQGDDQTVFFAL